MKKDEVFWKNKLDKFSYSILREAGTEMPFSGKYNMFFEEGYYKCKGCGNKLFDSKSKFNSGCGWPSFDASFLLVALISPLLSGIADYTGNKLRFLKFFCFLGSFSVMSLFFFKNESLSIFLIANDASDGIVGLCLIILRDNSLIESIAALNS